MPCVHPLWRRVVPVRNPTHGRGWSGFEVQKIRHTVEEAFAEFGVHKMKVRHSAAGAEEVIEL